VNYTGEKHDVYLLQARNKTTGSFVSSPFTSAITFYVLLSCDLSEEGVFQATESSQGFFWDVLVTQAMW